MSRLFVKQTSKLGTRVPCALPKSEDRGVAVFFLFSREKFGVP